MTDARQEYSLGGFGVRLKAAREAMHLSQKDAAMRLHLNPSVLDILETEHFDKAPPATFLRGYLRSYARLLNFSEDEINTILAQSGLETKTSAPVMPALQTETMQMTDRHVQRISTFVILGLFVFTGIWWGFHSSSMHTNTLARSAPQPVATPVVQQPQPVATPAPVATNVNQAPAPAQPVTPPQPAVAQSAAPVVPAAPVATTTQPPASAPVTPAAPPALAGTPPTVAPGAPNIPLADPFATLPLQPGTAVASTNEETPKKRNRHHKQDSTVSGFAMALPEPGL